MRLSRSWRYFFCSAGRSTSGVCVGVQFVSYAMSRASSPIVFRLGAGRKRSRVERRLHFVDDGQNLPGEQSRALLGLVVGHGAELRNDGDLRERTGLLGGDYPFDDLLGRSDHQVRRMISRSFCFALL